MFFLYHILSFYLFLVFHYFFLKLILVNLLLKVQFNVGEWLQFLKVILDEDKRKRQKIFYLGLGISMSVMAFFLTVYYAMLIAYSILYLILSFRSKLEWATCSGSWASASMKSKFILFIL